MQRLLKSWAAAAAVSTDLISCVLIADDNLADSTQPWRVKADGANREEVRAPPPPSAAAKEFLEMALTAVPAARQAALVQVQRLHHDRQAKQGAGSAGSAGSSDIDSGGSPAQLPATPSGIRSKSMLQALERDTPVAASVPGSDTTVAASVTTAASSQVSAPAKSEAEKRKEINDSNHEKSKEALDDAVKAMDTLHHRTGQASSAPSSSSPSTSSPSTSSSQSASAPGVSDEILKEVKKQTDDQKDEQNDLKVARAASNGKAEDELKKAEQLFDEASKDRQEGYTHLKTAVQSGSLP